MDGRPKMPLTPLELLDNDGTREQPFLSKYFNPVACGTVAFLAVICGNWASKRPYFSGIQKHISAVVLGLGAGVVIDKYRDEYLADRDAVYRHYIQLHPEDFPPYERKQYKDVFEKWIPIR